MDDALAEAGKVGRAHTADKEKGLADDADLFIKSISRVEKIFAPPDDDDDENFLKRLVVGTSWFQMCILVAVLIGATIAGIQTSKSMRDNEALKALDVVILGVFTLEAVLRMAAEWPTPQKYFSDNWNVFDFCIVLVGLADTVASQISSASIGGGTNFFVVLRLFRLFRVLKMLRAVPQLQLLASTMLSSLPLAAWLMVPIVLTFYIFACLGCFIFGEKDAKYFGRLDRAFITLTQVFTLDSWNGVLYVEVYGCKNYYRDLDKKKYGCDDAFEGHGRWTAVYFFAFIILNSYCILNLFVAIVMGQMLESVQEIEQLNEELAEADGEDQIRDERSHDDSSRHASILNVMKSIKRKVDTNTRRTVILKQTLDDVAPDVAARA